MHNIDTVNNVYDNCDFDTDLNAIEIIDVDVRSVNQSDDRFKAKIKINGVEIKFEVDSGSRVTIIPVSLLKKHSIEIKLESTRVRFRSYTKGTFYLKGVANVKVEFQKCRAILKLYVIDEDYTRLCLVAIGSVILVSTSRISTKGSTVKVVTIARFIKLVLIV